MKKLFVLALMAALLIGFGLPTPGFADLAAGLEGFRRGDYETAFKELKVGAQQNDKFAQYFLGLLYDQGPDALKGVARDASKSEELWVAAAGQDHPCAHFALAELYASRASLHDSLQRECFRSRREDPSAICETWDFEKSPQDFRTESEEHYVRAAELGFAPAMRHLGWAYANKYSNLPYDRSKATRWWKRYLETLKVEALRGNVLAQFELADAYYNGNEADYRMGQDQKESLRWYLMAAEQGNPEAQTQVASMYLEGEGIPQNYGEARRWFRESAEQGDTYAQHQFGLMHMKGQGDEKDLVQAHLWLNLATAANRGYKKDRDLVEGQMTQAELAKAQAKASEWWSTHKDAIPLDMSQEGELWFPWAINSACYPDDMAETR